MEEERLLTVHRRTQREVGERQAKQGRFGPFSEEQQGADPGQVNGSGLRGGGGACQRHSNSAACLRWREVDFAAVFEHVRDGRVGRQSMSVTDGLGERACP